MLFSKTDRFCFGIAGIVLTSLLCSLHFGVGFVSAYTASITTNDSITFEASPSGDGTSIHTESINVQSDCRAGYNLTIATPEGSSLYKDGNSSNSATFTGVDGTSALNNSNNTNKWGYTLTADPTGNTVFLPLSSTQTILKTSAQTASAGADINDTFSINYGAQVSSSVDPGTYQMANNGGVVYYLTMDLTCTQYTVSFNPNGGTVADGGNNPTQGIESGVPTKLNSSESLKAPTTASYTDAGSNTISGVAGKLWAFWGWNTAVDGSGDWYKDREEVEDLTTTGSTITLYAQWKQATLADMVAGTQIGTEKVINHNEMQDMGPEVCYNSTAYSADTSLDAHTPYDASTNPNGYHTITLNDYRGKVTTGENPESPEQYTVSKLPDNLCWMTKDLNLGRTSGGANNDGTITLTSDDTDLADNTTFTLPASPTTYTTGTVGYYTPQILINHTVNSYTVNNISYSPTISHYSWAAATATNTSISDSGELTTSICPKNWDLPDRTQFYNLRIKGSISSAAIAHADPYNFVYGGYRNAASGYSSQTSRGYYWTSSNSSSGYAYWNYAYNYGIYDSATSSGSKYYGAKVRCVASRGKATINYEGNGTNEYPVTGTTASQDNVEINTTKTRRSGFTRTGWSFSGWNTAVDGSGVSISSDTPISNLDLEPGGTITLYAQWLPQYTITYVNNCLSYANGDPACDQPTSDDTYVQRINLNASGNGSGYLQDPYYWTTLANKKIAGWNTSADGSGTDYRPDSSYAVTGQGAGDGIILYARWEQVYSIQYNGNGATNSNGMGTTDGDGKKSIAQIDIVENDQMNLLPSNFKRAGYGFVGWSTDSDAWTHFTDNDNTNDPVIYGPMEKVTVDANMLSSADNKWVVNMYAVWAPAAKDGNNNTIYLQEWDDPSDPTDGCAALTKTNFDDTVTDEKGKITVNKNSIIALTDKRDNMVYTVAKLADNNCWMVENLRLDNQYTMGQNQNDSSVSNASLAQGYGGTPGSYGMFVGLANSESANFSNSATANSVYKSSANPPVDTYNPLNNTLEDIGTLYEPYNRLPRYNNSNTNNLIDSTSALWQYLDSEIYSYGNYYNWPAAVANTNPYVAETDGTSICPAGWHLPSGYDYSTDKEFSVLFQSYGGTGSTQSGTSQSGDVMSDRLRSFPNNFIYSGGFYSSSTNSRGQYGYYWSRTGAGRAYSLELDSTAIYLYSNSNYSGFSVRCMSQ